MANKDPISARRGKALKRLKGIAESDIVIAEKALWSAILEITARLNSDANNNDLCKLTTTLARASAEIRGIQSDRELRHRLEALERAISIIP